MKKQIFEKSHNAEKLKEGTLRGFFNIHSVAKHRKIEGGPFGEKIFRKKSLTEPKKIERGVGLARYGMLRGKTGKTFLVQFARPNGAIWSNNNL